MDKLHGLLQKLSVVPVLALVWLLAVPPAADAQDTIPTQKPLWTREFGDEVSALQTTVGPLIIAQAANNLVALDKATGVVAWTLEFNADQNTRFSRVPGTDIALLMESRAFPRCENRAYTTVFDCGRRVSVVDLSNGLTLWNTDSLGDFVTLACLVNAEDSLCLLVKSDGRDSPWLSAQNLYTGRTVWERHGFFDESKPDVRRNSDGFTTMMGNPSPVWDTDSTVIVFFSRELLQKINARSGQVIWSCRLDDKPDAGDSWTYGEPTLSLDNRVVYVPCKKRLWAIALRDGLPSWSKPSEMRGTIVQIEDRPEGVLVRCVRGAKGIGQRPGITMLDHESGKQLWKRDFLKLDEDLVSNFVTREKFCYIWSKNAIYRIGVDDGAYDLLTDDAGLKGYETSVHLLTRDSGLLLVETQNAILFGYDGAEIFHTYHAQPGLSEAQIIVVALATVALGAVVLEAIGPTSGVWTGYSRTGESEELNNRFIGSWYNADYLYMTVKKAGPPQKAVRKSVTNRSREVDAGQEQVSGIVKVDLRTGQTVSELPLDDDAPMYDVAIDDGLLFYVVRNDQDKALNRRIVAAYAM